MARSCIKKTGLNAVPKRPSKPLNEASASEMYTPDWDAVMGYGQRNKEVTRRYTRGSSNHPHLRTHTQGK
jgi:hypothetical protein